MRPLVLILSLLLYFNTVNAQIITTVVGNGIAGYIGDNATADSAELNDPIYASFDNTGNMLIADSKNNVIRRVSQTGIITTVAGKGSAGYTGDGGLAILAELYYPTDVVTDDSGNLYIADAGNNVIRKINSAGKIETIAGTGLPGSSGDGGNAIFATLNTPYGIAIDKIGIIYITDGGNHKIRKIDTSGTISTIAGTGISGSLGDGGPAINARLGYPGEIVINSLNEIYFSDWNNHKVRKIDTHGIITTVAGTGISGNSGDGGLATSAELNAPNGIKFDDSGNLYISDNYANVVRKVNTSGIISTIAGTGSQGYTGDGGPALSATFNRPNCTFFDDFGNIYIVDSYNNCIRKITFNTGVNNVEKQEANITIHPNPASTQIDISTSTKIENIVITNAIGQTVFIQNNINSEKLQIDISPFPAGFYFVKINGTYKSKFLKK